MPLNPKVTKLLELATECPVGSAVDYKGLKATVMAFSDENIFLTVPEIACTPEQFEGSKDHKAVRDRELANLKAEVYSLREELERVLLDERYYEHKRRYERERRYGRDISYDQMRRAREVDMNNLMSMDLRPRHPGEDRLDAIPVEQRWVDPLAYKLPSQQRR